MTAFVTYFMVLVVLGPLFATLKRVAKRRPSLWAILAGSLIGYAVGGGGLIGLFGLTEPKGLDLAVGFLPLVTGIWAVAAAFYVISVIPRPVKTVGGQTDSGSAQIRH